MIKKMYCTKKIYGSMSNMYIVLTWYTNMGIKGTYIVNVHNILKKLFRKKIVNLILNQYKMYNSM